jgi:hypothetical protein
MAQREMFGPNKEEGENDTEFILFFFFFLRRLGTLACYDSEESL